MAKVSEVAPAGDLFITTTGCKDVIDYDTILKLKNGALLANAGHFNVEISVDALEKNAVAKNKINDHVYQYQLSNNKAVYLIAEGRLVNLAAARGTSFRSHGHELCKSTSLRNPHRTDSSFP